MRCKRLLLLLMMVCCWGSGAQAQSCGRPAGGEPNVLEGLYQGTIGDIQINAEFYQRSGLNVGTYASVRQGVDLHLEVFGDGPQLILPVSRKGADGLLGCLRVEQRGMELLGQWRSADGKTTLPVRWKKVDVATVALHLPDSSMLRWWREQRPFNFLKANHPWQVSDGGRMVTDPVSGVRFPCLPGEDAINRVLEQKQLEAVMLIYEKHQSMKGFPDLKFTSVARITRQTRYLVSVMHEWQAPDTMRQAQQGGWTFDRLTGRELPLTDLLPFLTYTDLNNLIKEELRQRPVQAKCRFSAWTERVDWNNYWLTTSSLLIPLSGGADTLDVDPLCRMTLNIPLSRAERWTVSSPYADDLAQ